MLVGVVLTLGACGGGGDEPADLNEPTGERGDLKRRIDDAERRLERLRERERKERRRSREDDPLRGANELLASLDAEAGFTVGPPGGSEAHAAGGLTGGSAWSTIKVPIALRVLQSAGGPEALTAAQRNDIESAITRSDNEAAARLYAGLGSTAAAAREVESVLRDAGDDRTSVSTEGRGAFSPYGQTDWSLKLQHRFMAALAGGCVGDERDSQHLLDLMGSVTSDTWGLGSAGGPARWKGGWGPGTDGRYLARQMGVLEFGNSEAVVTLAVIPNDGQFESGQRAATAIARWLHERADALAGPAGDC